VVEEQPIMAVDAVHKFGTQTCMMVQILDKEYMAVAAVQNKKKIPNSCCSIEEHISWNQSTVYLETCDVKGLLLLLLEL
jgi:hypothetical protein